jgi:hypothetical protein
MSEREGANTGVDDLLKRVFADGLPADVEAGMRASIVRFREGTAKDREANAAWAWLLRRGAVAILSILMLAAGILLQGLGSRSSLAERISQVKAEFSQEATS